jgi:arylsulfatase A-like enzyme
MSWQRAIRNKQYKLIEYCVDKKRHTQLFDLKSDSFETTNLADDPNYAHVLDSLRAILKRDKVLLNDGNTLFEFTNEQGKYFWDTYNSDKQ